MTGDGRKEAEMIRTLWSRAQAWRNEVLRDTLDDERGDVPGWVLVTLMTAGLPVVTFPG